MSEKKGRLGLPEECCLSASRGKTERARERERETEREGERPRGREGEREGRRGERKGKKKREIDVGRTRVREVVEREKGKGRKHI